MVLTVLKTTFQKAKPKEIIYRDYKKFERDKFRYDIKRQLVNIKISDYIEFERIFVEVLNKHAPQKKKIVRANQALLKICEKQ